MTTDDFTPPPPIADMLGRKVRHTLAAIEQRCLAAPQDRSAAAWRSMSSDEQSACIKRIVARAALHGFEACEHFVDLARACLVHGESRVLRESTLNRPDMPPEWKLSVMTEEAGRLDGLPLPLAPPRFGMLAAASARP